ncbi:MAG: hypothetical protein IPF63_11595 [Bacteroidetes bacterium]|nr:hypothetical protein [Bacteroidota bacterium]
MILSLGISPFYPTPGNHDYGSVIQSAMGIGPYFNIVKMCFRMEKQVESLPIPKNIFYDYGNVHFYFP